MEPSFNVMFSDQSCTSWPLKYDPWSLLFDEGIHTWFSFFNPLMVAAWFARQLGMLGLGQIHYPYKPGHIWSPHSEVNIINLPISHWLGTSLEYPTFLWKLPWALFKIQRTCCYCINQVVFSRAIWHPWQYAIPSGHYGGLSLWIHSAVSTEGSVARACYLS